MVKPAGAVTASAMIFQIGQQAGLMFSDQGIDYFIDACFNFPKNENPEPGGSIALDEANQLLYVADTESHIIRVVDLAAGTVDLLAGTPLTAGDQDAFDIPDAKEFLADQAFDPLAPSRAPELDDPAQTYDIDFQQHFCRRLIGNGDHPGNVVFHGFRQIMTAGNPSETDLADLDPIH